MTFRDVVFKNFKGSFQKYFAYFLSGAFSIMLFFMYSTLFLNKKLEGRDDTEVLSYLFPITLVAIALFAVFFINYANAAFMKGRNKEFGIYVSLGIDSKELNKLINIENMLISIASMLAGIGTGALLSRLFQMVILKMLDIKDIPFYLDYKPFLLTVALFLFIYATVMAETFIRMRKTDITGLLREARKSEGRDYSGKDLMIGSLGLVIMVLSVLFTVIISGNEKLNSNLPIMLAEIITAIFGVYLVLLYGGNLIIHLIKKSRGYYKNLLSVTELHYKFSQNSRIIFVLSILSAMTVFFVASPFSLLNLSEKIAESNDNNLEYVETNTVNKLPEGKLDEILKGEKVTSNKSVKFIYLSTVKGSDDLKDCKPVVSVSEYNRLMNTHRKLTEGEAFHLIIGWYPGDRGIKQGSLHEVYLGTDSVKYQFMNSSRGKWIAGADSFPNDGLIILNDKDYVKLAEKVTLQNTAYYHIISFKNWKESRETVEAVKSALGNSGLKVVSTIEAYEGLKRSYSVFLFVSTVMGIMFFVAGGSVLYFKQYTELPETKATFYKLYKIGITIKEIKSIVAKELSVIFFLPLVFGTFLGVLLIYMMTNIMGGESILKEFITNAFVVVAVYFLFQGVFYLITRNKYIAEIIKK